MAKKTKMVKEENPVATLSVELGGMTEIEKFKFCNWLIQQASFIGARPAAMFAKTYRARLFRR